MKIWIEVELNSTWLNQYSICEREDLRFDIFKDLTPEIWIKMSEEYYNETIEYNFTPFHYNENLLWDVKKYLEWQIKKYELHLSNGWPAFVWMHIHFFDETMLNVDKKILLWKLLSFLADNLDWLQKYSVIRLIKAHQLWTYWSHHNRHIWKKTMENYYLDTYCYNDYRNKMKYSPIINSPATNMWKPPSLEIRLLPNEFLFNWKLLELLDEINSWKIYERKSLTFPKFMEKIANVLHWQKRVEIISTPPVVNNREEEVIMGDNINVEEFYRDFIF